LLVAVDAAHAEAVLSALAAAGAPAARIGAVVDRGDARILISGS
jgi:hydrogenase maturation factor